jgi:peptide methionine sulfoxide reductase MsrA
MAKDNSTRIHSKNDKDPEIATLANGCFWRTEAIFSRVKGIKSVIPGYSGRETAINEAIAIYLETKQKCEKEKIQIAPMEVISK